MEFLLCIFDFDDELFICYACCGDDDEFPIYYVCCGGGDDEFPICNVSF